MFAWSSLKLALQDLGEIRDLLFRDAELHVKSERVSISSVLLQILHASSSFV